METTDETRRITGQTLCHPSEAEDGDVPLAPLALTDVGPVQACTVRDFLLSEPEALAPPPDAVTEFLQEGVLRHGGGG